jgi:hypothetical protein
VFTLCLAFSVIVVRLGRGKMLTRATHYRRMAWASRDTEITIGALVALVAIGAALQLAPASLRYDPYPDLTFPQTQPVVVLLLAALVIPAIVAPHPGNQVMTR